MLAELARQDSSVVQVERPTACTNSEKASSSLALHSVFTMRQASPLLTGWGAGSAPAVDASASAARPAPPIRPRSPDPHRPMGVMLTAYLSAGQGRSGLYLERNSP